MSDLYDDEPVTLRQLIHHLTAEYTLMNERVYVGTYDSTGEYALCAVTGISVRTGKDGKPVQSLEFELVRDE